MPAIGRRVFLGAVSLPLLAAAAPAGLVEFLGDLATDLSSANLGGVMKRFDPAMAGYEEVRVRLHALIARFEIACSIEILNESAESDGQNAARHTLDLDWILSLTDIGKGTLTERRREQVKVAARRRGKSWVIVSLEPLRFFEA